MKDDPLVALARIVAVPGDDLAPVQVQVVPAEGEPSPIRQPVM
jgi:hypothetical protein